MNTDMPQPGPNAESLTAAENEPKLLNLNRDPHGRPFLVDMERFFEFSFWMAEELEDLVSRYQHRERMAAATRQTDFRRRIIV